MISLKLAFFVTVLCCTVGAIASPLGPYKVLDVTVSGFSSGAFMAVQMHVAYSSLVNGSAIFAGVSTFKLFPLYLPHVGSFLLCQGESDVR